VIDDVLKSSLQPAHAFRVVASAVMCREPADLFIAPVGAVQKVLAATKLMVEDIDLIEINEAFASQTLACIQQLGLPHDKVNVHGGAIALGHPIGCSGTRVLVTLMHALVSRQARFGIATLCLGGGEAVAMLIEHHVSSS
jgi:acetyl-CoA C-acetyltransferase